MDPCCKFLFLLDPNFRCKSLIYFGGAERDRTADLLVANEALSQLSYSPPPRRALHTTFAGTTPSNDKIKCISKRLLAQTSDLLTRPVTAVPAASGFSTRCQTSPALSISIANTGTSSRLPLRAIASITPVSPGPKSVRSRAICQRCCRPSRDSSRISVTTAANSLTSPPPLLVPQ